MTTGISEAVLQFGAGKFLRAFVDRFIQQANDAGQAVGRVVIVQSTPGARADRINRQGGGYSVLVRGYQDGQVVERTDRVNVVSRALSAVEQWDEVLTAARSPELKYVVTNATEAGYATDPADKADSAPPKSMPGKLTQVLWKRFEAGAPPLTLLPCELIERNADKLIELVAGLADTWKLPAGFEDWVRNKCVWLNNLVDCIVTDPPADLPLAKQDPLLQCAEPYALWAIERPKGRAVSMFTHPAIKLVDELSPYFLRKVRILNGTHTAMAAKFGSAFATVIDVLNDRTACRWVRDLIFEEIVPVLAYRLDGAAEFADETFDRLRNPFARHKLSDIRANHAAKVKVRLEPTRDEYLKLFGQPPRKIAEALAVPIP